MCSVYTGVGGSWIEMGNCCSCTARGEHTLFSFMLSFYRKNYCNLSSCLVNHHSHSSLSGHEEPEVEHASSSGDGEVPYIDEGADDGIGYGEDDADGEDGGDNCGVEE